MKSPLLLTPLLAVALLAGCAGSVSPPARLYQLRSEPPAGAPMAPLATDAVWQLGRVQLPAYLDRDTLLMPSGQSALQPLSGHRWAEPLRDAVPRLLRQDLARLLGQDRIWGQPLPPGVQITRQLLLEVQRLDATPAGDAVVLQARWTLVDPLGKQPPQVSELELTAPVATGASSASPPTAGPGAAAAARADEADRLVAAHREVLWQLARRIASASVPAATSGSGVPR